MSTKIEGEEREVKFLGGAAVDGAPVAYVVVLAAVVTVLSFIPFSVVLSSGGSFPLSQGIFPLLGWLLGPIAGAVATGIGAAIGIFLAPHTAGYWFANIPSYMLASFAAGVMVWQGPRKRWWLIVLAIIIIAAILFFGRAIVFNKVGAGTMILASLTQISGALLWILPTRTLFAKWINGKNYLLLVIGLFLGTWMCTGLMRLGGNAISYQITNLPEKVFLALIPMIPLENVFRSLVGTVIGVGLIAGLRAIGTVKPRHALY